MSCLQWVKRSPLIRAASYMLSSSLMGLPVMILKGDNLLFPWVDVRLSKTIGNALGQGSWSNSTNLASWIFLSHQCVPPAVMIGGDKCNRSIIKWAKFYRLDYLTSKMGTSFAMKLKGYAPSRNNFFPIKLYFLPWLWLWDKGRFPPNERIYKSLLTYMYRLKVVSAV